MSSARRVALRGRDPAVGEVDMTRHHTAQSGVFGNAMAYVRLGDGHKSLLYIPGGPGNDLPEGTPLRMLQPMLRPLTEDGFTIWMVTRPRNMPAGHSIEDMADDYAALVRDEFGGRVDAVIGESMGGLIVQYLAANHGDCADTIVVFCAACEVSDWGKGVTRREASAVANGSRFGLGLAMGEYMLPGERYGWLRALLAPLLATMTAGRQHEHYRHDHAIEAQAVVDFDSRGDLPRITVPVLLVSGDADLFFPKGVVEETARLIPDCHVIWYPGQGHVRAGTNTRLGSDVLDYIRARPRNESARPT
jgi:pimeloyl-ACP methyl ester carboxylesterase